MLWLLKKLLILGVVIGLVILVLNLDYQGVPIKQRIETVLKTPLVQEISRQARGIVVGYLKKDVQELAPAMEEIGEKERKDLERLLEEASRK